MRTQVPTHVLGRSACYERKSSDLLFTLLILYIIFCFYIIILLFLKYYISNRLTFNFRPIEVVNSRVAWSIIERGEVMYLSTITYLA